MPVKTWALRKMTHIFLPAFISNPPLSTKSKTQRDKTKAPRGQLPASVLSIQKMKGTLLTLTWSSRFNRMGDWMGFGVNDLPGDSVYLLSSIQDLSPGGPPRTLKEQRS